MTEPDVPDALDAPADPAEPGEIGIARVRHLIELNQDADSDEFERLMLHDIFERVNTQEEGASADSADAHTLLAARDFGRNYVWEIRMFYFIHQTPTPGWLLNRAELSFQQVSDDVEAFGRLTSSEVLFDVREWRQRLGRE